MKINSQEILEKYGDQLYFFILRKVKDKDMANDVFQNTFLKIHTRLHQLNNIEKIKSWIFQIGRNEIADHFTERAHITHDDLENLSDSRVSANRFCCFDRFIHELPENYQVSVELVYLKGMKQQDAAGHLGITLANVKARIRRAKAILKQRFKECCKFQLDRKGNLVGEPDCSFCNTH